LDRALRPVTVTHDPVTSIRQLHILPQGNERIGFGDQSLRKHSPGAFAGKLAQRIVNRVRLTQPQDGRVSKHGVSLLQVLAGSPPASIRRLSQSVVTQIPA